MFSVKWTRVCDPGGLEWMGCRATAGCLKIHLFFLGRCAGDLKSLGAWVYSFQRDLELHLGIRRHIRNRRVRTIQHFVGIVSLGELWAEAQSKVMRKEMAEQVQQVRQREASWHSPKCSRLAC